MLVDAQKRVLADVTVKIWTYHNFFHHGIVAFVSTVEEGLVEDFNSTFPVIIDFELLGLLEGSLNRHLHVCHYIRLSVFVICVYYIL